jgi:hypothetical protein
MIDTDKYEGHAEGEWVIEMNDTGDECAIHAQDYGTIAQTFYRDCDKLFLATTKLIADAPLLLKEVKRLYQAITDIADEMEQVSLTEYEQEVIEDLRKVIETQNIINQYEPKIIFCYDFPKESYYHGSIISTMKWKAIENNWNYVETHTELQEIKKWHEKKKETDPSYNNDEWKRMIFMKTYRWR